MTALRNFPDAPMARRRARNIEWKLPPWTVKVWNALQRYGRMRGAWELEVLADRRALGDPLLARRLRAAAAEMRQDPYDSSTPN